jgi:serine/threonine-protein kinase
VTRVPPDPGETTVAERRQADTRTDPAGHGTTRSFGRGTSIGRYLLLDRIGEGGMGVVFKADDPELGRPVALKLVSTENGPGTQPPGLPPPSAELSRYRERLLGEAQALARLQHPNVITVHDVGTFGADVFIAMEFVEGRNLRAWRKDRPRSTREILEVFLTAGEGLVAAHRAGLVHRDFKPDNVMMGDDGRVRVLDFGLARATGGADATDEVAGTPRFMAPEQHLGEAVGQAADQFSFCVSIYWSLYDRFPFQTVDDAVSGRVEEPAADSGVPRWLRQALLRGLLPRPADRYPSMAALLEALRADPALARRRRLRTALAVLSAAALVSAFAEGTAAYRTRRSAARQAQLQQTFGQEVEKIAAIARFAAFLPLHDTRSEMSTIRERMERLKERMRALGPLAAGPGHQALGRGHLALEHYEDALRELSAARATGYRSPELEYALGLVHGKLYQRALADLSKTGDEKVDAARRAELALAHRDPALRHLKEAGAHGGVEAPEYVEGLIRLYEQRFDDALALARRAAQRSSWLFEARTLEGDIHLMAGQERSWKGDVDGALDELRRAGEAYRAVTAMARSSAPAYAGECRRLLEIALIEVDRNQSPEASMKGALAACDAASIARPDDANTPGLAARVWHVLAHHQASRGIDPSPAEESAIRLGQRSLALDAQQLRAHEVIGLAQTNLAEYRANLGVDPRPALEQALEHAQRMLRIDPNLPEAHHLAMRAHQVRGEYELLHGIDPRTSLKSGIAHGQRLIAFSPGSYSSYIDLGILYANLGDWDRLQGLDPSDDYGRAVAADEKVAQLGPTLDYGYANLCSVYRPWAEFEMSRGLDPRPRLKQAMTSCRRAIEISGDFDGSHLELGWSGVLLATWELEHAIDPTRAIETSRAELERTLELHPDHVEALSELGELRLLRARWFASRGRDPLPEFAAGEKWIRRSLAVSDGKSAGPLWLLAELDRRRAEWREAHRLGFAADVQEGLRMAARALEQHPRLGLAAAVEGALHLVVARAAAAPAARRAAAERARAALSHALSIDKNLEREVQPLLTELDRLVER